MMALMNTKRLAVLAWAFVNTSLLLLIGVELGWGEKLKQPMPAPVAPPSAPVKIELPPDFRLPAREKAYSGTLDRPLFVPSRQKAPPPPPPPPPTMKKGQFQLLGTVITDEMKAAIVKEVSSGKVRQVVQGYTINGLQLDVVEPNRIVFSQYEDQEEIRLKIQPSPKPAPAAPGAQPANPQAAAPTAPGQLELPARWAKRQGAAGQPRPAAMPSQQEVPARPQRIPSAPQTIPSAPQTMEERRQNPLMKDFYKQ
jgi:hypothetical protein